MKHTIKRQVIVKPGGVVEITASELTPGLRADVVIIQEDMPAKPMEGKLTSLVGSGKGSYSTPAEADKFIRDERDSWIAAKIA